MVQQSYSFHRKVHQSTPKKWRWKVKIQWTNHLKYLCYLHTCLGYFMFSVNYSFAADEWIINTKLWVLQKVFSLFLILCCSLKLSSTVYGNIIHSIHIFHQNKMLFSYDSVLIQVTYSARHTSGNNSEVKPVRLDDETERYS